MTASILIGFCFGLIAIFSAYMIEGGTLNSLLIIPAILIVLGGSLAASVSGFGINVIKKIVELIVVSQKKSPSFYADELILQFIRFATIARKEGVLVLENRLEELSNPLLRKMFRMLIDGSEIKNINRGLDSEVNQLIERHSTNISIFTKLGGYSPTMGIIGTVLGLISTLAAAGSDPQVLIRNIATAFIATFWGIFLANILWLPIADKLKNLHNEELRLYQVLHDAFNSLGNGETPSLILERLVGYYPISKQNEKLIQFKKELE